MALTSSDGVGTLVIGKAACSKVSALIRCLPYDATLYQNGEKLHFELASGTVWLNPTTTEQPLSYTSAHIPPRGVLMAVSTKNGQTVSLTGTVDEVGNEYQDGGGGCSDFRGGSAGRGRCSTRRRCTNRRRVSNAGGRAFGRRTLRHESFDDRK